MDMVYFLVCSRGVDAVITDGLRGRFLRLGINTVGDLMDYQVYKLDLRMAQSNTMRVTIDRIINEIRLATPKTSHKFDQALSQQI